MAAKLTRQTHKIAINLHLVAEICTICSYLSTHIYTYYIGLYNTRAQKQTRMANPKRDEFYCCKSDGERTLF
jgi:hypothetical protein